MNENTNIEIEKVIKPRAEDYTDAEMLKLNPYIFFPYSNNSDRLLVIGERGVGKTFSIRHSLLMSKTKAKMYIFRKNKKMELLYDGGDELIIYDDIHYICESVLRGETDIGVLLALFRQICQEDKHVILISDSPLCFYANHLNNEEFNILINTLGEYVHRNGTKRENVDFMAKIEFPRISDGGIINIANDGHKKIQKEALLYLLKMRPSPRELVNFINLFKKDITYQDMVDRIQGQLSQAEMKTLANRNMPCDRLKKDSLEQLLKSFESYPDFEHYMKNFNMLRMQIIGQLRSDMTTIPLLHPDVQLTSSWKRLAKLLKKRSNISEDGKCAEVEGQLMTTYYALLRNLKKQGKYSGDLSLFTGWKGNFISIETELKKLNDAERLKKDGAYLDWNSLWNFKTKGVKRCDICKEECIIPIIKKYYEKQYQEYSKIAELKRVMVEGKYHYE